MKQLIFLIGLPCSGKSFLGNQYKNFCFIDDIKERKQLEDALLIYDKIIISDVFLCRKSEQELVENWLKDKNFDIKWIFFENNPKKCLKNMKFRNDGRKVENLIKDLSKVYFIPENIKPLEIWQK